MIRPLAFWPDLSQEKHALYKLNKNGRVLRVIRHLLEEERDLVGETPESIILNPHIAAICRQLMDVAIDTALPQTFTAQVRRGGELVLRLCIIQRVSGDEALIYSYPFSKHILEVAEEPTSDL